MQAKRSLGQNFLKSKAAIADIIKAADLSEGDTVLEVGPGKGVLTEALLEKAGKVIAVEKDDRLIEFLQEKFAKEISEKRFVLIHADILEFDLTQHVAKDTAYKLVANIPYYITGQLFRTFLESKHQPSRMVILVQKEVAQRVVARDDKESLLSLSVKAYGGPKYIAKVAARYFSPAPKVDSAVLLIENISKTFFSDTQFSEAFFFEVLHLAFAHKRKIVASNLAERFPKEKVLSIFAALDIISTARAEDISIDLWKKIASQLVGSGTK